MSMLKDTTVQAEAAVGSYGSAALLFTVPTTAKAPGQATFKHTGSAGFWYVQFQRDVIGSGPTTTVYSMKLSPGEEFTEDNMPLGTVYALAGGGAVGALSYYAGWRT